MKKFTYKERKLINEKIEGFFIGALDLGYSYDEAWSLLLDSEQGVGILNNDYKYSVHLQGRASAEKADNIIGYKYKKSSNIKPDLLKLEMLANLIDLAHYEFKIEYKDMFNNISLSKFMEACGSILGNYDHKLIKTYLIKH